jgi:hypothetical protein
VTEKMLQAVIDHGLLAAAICFAYWFATPHLVKKTLMNGGGLIIRQHIELANAEQSKETAKAVNAAVGAHEEREFRQYGNVGEGLTKVRENVASLGAKLEVHLAMRAV